MRKNDKQRIILLRKNQLLQLGALFLLFLFILSQAPVQHRAIMSPIFKGPAGEKVAITVNVDWGEDCIPRMLKIFEENDVRVTFFLTGRWARKFPNLTRAIFEKGHEIGNHGFEHIHPKKIDNEALKAHIKNNEILLEEICGGKTVLYAPPYGEFDQRIVSVAESLGYKVIMWTVDTVDWKRPAPQVIIDRVKRKISDGAIILMHPTEPTLKALPEIIKDVRDRGWDFVSVTELIKGGNIDENEN